MRYKASARWKCQISLFFNQAVNCTRLQFMIYDYSHVFRSKPSGNVTNRTALVNLISSPNSLRQEASFGIPPPPCTQADCMVGGHRFRMFTILVSSLAQDHSALGSYSGGTPGCWAVNLWWVEPRTHSNSLWWPFIQEGTWEFVCGCSVCPGILRSPETLVSSPTLPMVTHFDRQSSFFVSFFHLFHTM